MRNVCDLCKFCDDNTQSLVRCMQTCPQAYMALAKLEGTDKFNFDEVFLRNAREYVKRENELWKDILEYEGF